MSAATAVTPSSPLKTNITIQSAAKTVSAIWSGKNMKETGQSNPPTGAGEPSASACAGCGAQLLDTEVYACTSCLDLWLMLDPNFRLTGETDE